MYSHSTKVEDYFSFLQAQIWDMSKLKAFPKGLWKVWAGFFSTALQSPSQHSYIYRPGMGLVHALAALNLEVKDEEALKILLRA